MGGSHGGVELKNQDLADTADGGARHTVAAPTSDRSGNMSETLNTWPNGSTDGRRGSVRGQRVADDAHGITVKSLSTGAASWKAFTKRDGVDEITEGITNL